MHLLDDCIVPHGPIGIRCIARGVPRRSNQECSISRQGLQEKLATAALKISIQVFGRNMAERAGLNHTWWRRKNFKIQPSRELKDFDDLGHIASR